MAMNRPVEQLEGMCYTEKVETGQGKPKPLDQR